MITRLNSFSGRCKQFKLLIIILCNINQLNGQTSFASTHTFISSKIEVNPGVCCPPYSTLSSNSIVWTVIDEFTLPASTPSLIIETALRYNPVFGMPDAVTISDPKGNRLKGMNQSTVMNTANSLLANVSPFPSTPLDFTGFSWMGFSSAPITPNTTDTVIRYRIQYIWDSVPSHLCKYNMYGAIWNSHKIGSAIDSGKINILTKPTVLFSTLIAPITCNSEVVIKIVKPCTSNSPGNLNNYWYDVVGENCCPPINIHQQNQKLPELTIGNYTLYVTDSNAVPITIDTSTFSIDPPPPPTTITTMVACESYTWPTTGFTYTSSGYYSQHYIDTSLCQAVQVLQLSIFKNSSDTTSITSSTPYYWPLNGQTYSASGYYVHTSLNASNCIHTSYLALSIAFDLSIAVDQNISCFGLNDGAIQGTTNSPSPVLYSVDGASFMNNNGFITGLSPGTHTLCASDGFYTTCETIFIDEPLPLNLQLHIDSLPGLNTPNGGGLSVSISGGSLTFQPYLTYWYNSQNVLLNPFSNQFDTSITQLSSDSYTLIVQDNNFCADTVGIILPQKSLLSISCFIQHYWNGVNGMVAVLQNQLEPTTLDACDSLDVLLKDPTTFVTIDSSRAVLRQSGTCVVQFNDAYSGNYYLAIKHRSSIETWSATPISMSGFPSYNFTDAASKAYGANMVQLNANLWAFYSGDIVKDIAETIDLADAAQLEIDNTAFSYGYLASDLNGDGNIDLTDFSLMEISISEFIFSIHP